MSSAAQVLAPFQDAAQALATYCLTAVWMGVVVVALAALVVRWWKPLDASSRYVVWYVALIAIVLGPLATTVVVQYANRSPSVDQLVAATARLSNARNPMDAPALQRAHARIAVPAPVAYGLAGLWLLVVLGGCARFAAGMAVLARLKRDALPVCPELRRELSLWNAHAGARGARRARLCVSDRVDVPVAVGLFDAMVVLPQHVLDQFDAHDVDRFVLHELAHLERRDDWTAAVERVAQIVQFFNPVVHFVARRLDLEREIASDDRVVAATSDVRSYAVGLTRMAESTAWPHAALAAPAIFVTRKQLSLRVEELLARGRFTAPRVAIAPAALALAASLGVVAAAAVRAPAVGIGTGDALFVVDHSRGVAVRAADNQHVEVIVLRRFDPKHPVNGKPPTTIIYRTDTATFRNVPSIGPLDAQQVEDFLTHVQSDRNGHARAPIIVHTMK